MKWPTVQGKRIPDGQMPKEPGEWRYHRWTYMGDDTEYWGILCRLPEPGFGLHSVTIRRTGSQMPVPPKRPSWEWDGNIEKPTLSPSIKSLGGDNGKTEMWHGHLVAGVFVGCG